MSAQPYTQLAALQGLYLEDSFVLDVTAQPGRVAFIIDAVLTPDHPLYHPPGTTEQHCYRRGRVIFEGVEKLQWRSLGLRPARDASGETDYGGIDVYTYDGRQHSLQGDWGTMEIMCREVIVKLDA